MMNRSLTRLVMAIVALLGLIAPAQATDYSKCLTLYNTNCHQNMKMDADLVQQCIMRGWDPPVTCRNNNGVSSGVNVTGATGSIYGAISAPNESAGRIGAAPSVDSTTIRRTMGKQPWPSVYSDGTPAKAGCALPGGFNLCKLELSLGKPAAGAPATQDPNDPCPASSDTSGLYGAKTALTINQPSSVSLSCGGAVPLSNYEVTLNKNPTMLATTEYGSNYVWIYRAASTSGPFNLSGSAMKLPTMLCKEVKDANNATMRVRSVDLTNTIAQMITYDTSMKNLVIRLTPRSEMDPSAVPQKVPLYEEGEKEKYLVLPLSGGIPQIPSDPTNMADLAHAKMTVPTDPTKITLGALTPDTDSIPLKGCALDSDYFKTLDEINPKADLVIESSSNVKCEGSTAQCQLATAAADVETSCDVVSLTPPSSPGYSCDGKTQYAVLDRPSLVLPPGTQSTVTPITGRSSVLISSVDKSMIYLKPSSVLHIGSTAPAFTLNEGGNIQLSDGSSVSLYAPATINGATGVITLTGGGQHIGAGGNVLQTFTNGGSFQAPDKPVILTANRSITLPAGYKLPTMSTLATTPPQPPFVQIPLSK